MPGTAEKRAELEHIADRVRLCRNCDLCLRRQQAVPGEGNPAARIMFVGEAPGQQEDETGRPFVGAAGKFLAEMLGDIGLTRTDVFIANVIKCRPPGNRDPEPGEIEACAPWLRAQVATIAPRVICTLGRFAMAQLVDQYASISKVHGEPRERDGRLLIPLYHPAAALRNGSLREPAKEDMRRVRRELQTRGLWEEAK